MSIKYDLIDTYKSEAIKFRELELLTTAQRLAQAGGNFTSTTSSTVYTYTNGNDLFLQLQTVLTDYLLFALNINNKVETSDFETFQNENILSQYKKNVTVVDLNGFPTEVEYLRKSDDSLANKRTSSNPDSNGFYQTVVEEFYETDGITVYKTVTYTFTFLENGIIDTSDYVVS